MTAPTQDYLKGRGLSETTVAMAGLRIEPLGDRAAKYGLPREATGTPVLVIPYRHANGQVASERIRLIDEADIEHYGGGKYRSAAGSKAMLYDPLRALAGDAPVDSVILIEGELSTLAFTELLPGLPALGLPGQGSFKPDMAEAIAHVPTVYVWLDRDEQCFERNANLIQSRAEEAGIEDIRFLGTTAGMDANDVLMTFEIEKGHEGVVRLIEGAEPLAAAPPEAAAGTVPGVVDRDESFLTPFTDIVSRPVFWAWQDRIALGKITALAGRPKIGKGLLYSDLIAHVTRGGLEGDLEGPRDVIVVTTEDDPGDTLKPRLVAAGADLSRVSTFQMGTRDDPVPFRVPQDARELRHRVEEKNAALVVIDPLMEFVDGKVDSHKSQPVRQALAAVNNIARENDCAMLVIFHLNKSASTDPLLRHEGSAAFTQVVRGGLMLGHDPDDPEGEDGNQRVLAVSASNLAAIAPSLVYEISTARVDGDTGGEISTARMRCIGESSMGAHDLLSAPGDEERSERDDAVEFLRAELEDGPRPVKEIKAAASGAGLTWRTIERAKGALGVEAKRVGDGTHGGGFWEWNLKAANPPASPVAVLSGGLKIDGSVEPNGGLPNLKAATVSEVAVLRFSGAEPADSPPDAEPAEQLSENGAQGSDDGFEDATPEEADLSPVCRCPSPLMEDPVDGRCTRCWGKPRARTAAEYAVGEAS